MSQSLKFIRRSHGISKKGNNYDISEVSDGLSSFTLENGEGIGQQINELELNEGDEIEAEVHVKPVFGSLRGTIVSIDS
jgi:hypothetical protein